MAGTPARDAIRAVVHGAVQGVGFREATIRRALALGVTGWVRNEDDGSVRVHAEGPREAVAELAAFLERGSRAARVDAVELEHVGFEGHEQFAVRGVSAGRFVVREHRASSDHFDLLLQVGGTMRSWAIPKGPSMDPAVKRLALETGERAAPGAELERDDAIVWDRGSYEQGGRVPWPQALERGHAVFVLHGRKLRGGFALQRTGEGERARWLLVKRRDEHARPGSDAVAERPGSVLSDRVLGERGASRT